MSLGKDLASIRKEQGLTLEEIQSSIKIPMLTLKSIENGSIFDSTEHNHTYIRSFIRSYAKALKIDDKDIVDALDAHEAGIYNHDLLEGSVDEPEPISEEPTLINEESEESDFDLSQTTPPDINNTTPEKAPSVENVNWADMGKKFSLQDSGSKAKLAVGIIIVLIIALFIAGYFYWDNVTEWFDFSEPETVENSSPNVTPPILENDDPVTTPVDNETTTNDDVPGQMSPVQRPQPEAVEGTPRTPVSFDTENLDELRDTLTVVVYAAFDKLEPVRVTSDLNWRTNPFWMEQGQAFKFDFKDTLLVRGQYSRMLLMFNGHVIENPTNSYFNTDFNSVMLTRSDLQTSSFMEPAPTELPNDVTLPDSIVYRIQY
jgi:cytoskeletal protein RodZ